MKFNQKGITLIALVITIIVLLILAGISISMLSGDNGILRQASEAKEDTKKKTMEEQIKLAAVDAFMKGEDLITIEDVDDLNDALSSQGLNVTATGDATNGYTVTSEEDMYIISTTGAVKKKSIVTDVTPANYGDYIKGYKDLTDIEGNDKDWQLFLNDGNNVWIIASNYIQLSEKTASKTEMVTSGFCAYWSEAPELGEIYANGNCVKDLSDTTKWTEYVDTTFAEKAMGGPTLEMFAQSYNAKYPDGINGIIDFTKYDSGYDVGWKKR